MSCKTTYTCDICQGDTPKESLYGCNFISPKRFRLEAPECTNSVHICVWCLDQIQAQIESRNLPHKEAVS